MSRTGLAALFVNVLLGPTRVKSCLRYDGESLIASLRRLGRRGNSHPSGRAALSAVAGKFHTKSQLRPHRAEAGIRRCPSRLAIAT
jgi:hypothetical protein